MDDAELAIGAPDAPVTVVEYLSTTCSHCAAFAADTLPIVERDYLATGKVRLIIRELPTAPVAVAAAGFLLARCAGRERYWEAVRELLARQAYILSTPDAEIMLRRTAEALNLDIAFMRACLSDEEAISALNARRQAAIDAGIDSTPTFIFNGVKLAAGTKLAAGKYVGGELSPGEWRAAYTRAAKGAPKLTESSRRPSP